MMSRVGHLVLHSAVVNNPFTVASNKWGRNSICQHSFKTILFYGLADNYHPAKPMWWNPQTGCRLTVSAPPITAGTDQSKAIMQGVQTIDYKYVCFYETILPGGHLFWHVCPTQCLVKRHYPLT